MLPIKVKTTLFWIYLPLTIIDLHHIVLGKCSVGVSGEKLMFPRWHEPQREQIEAEPPLVCILIREKV